MNEQEEEFLQEIQLTSQAIKLLAMLHLNSSSSSSSATTAVSAGTTSPPSATKSPVSISARTTRKRRSPSLSSPLQKKLFSKRTSLFPSPPTTAAITTSPTAGNFPSPPLQRSFSEPINYALDSNIPEASNQLINSLSPKKSTKNGAGSFLKSPSRPPLPPSLRRTTSAPIPADYQVLALSATPPSNPVAISDQETAKLKRLKRMKEKMQEMTEWCYEVMREADEATASQDECKKDDESHEESVWVEENNGGSLMIHFKCPCDKRYEILLSGNNCYYKLM